GGGSTVVAAGRMRESGIDERIDRETSNLFGFAGKIRPEKFSGGGRRRRVVAGRKEAAAGGGEWGEIPRKRDEDGGGGVNGGGKAAAKVVVVLRRWLAEEVMMVSAAKRGGSGAIFLYNTSNEAFKILEEKVLLKLSFSDDPQNPKPKTVVSAGRSKINSDHEILMEKFEALTTKINFEFLIIKKEIKETRDDNHSSKIYIRDNMLMCEPYEANYVQRYHRGYHDQKPKNLYSNQNRNYLPRNRIPHPSRYFKPKTSMEEIMKEWMARKMEANEHMKDQGVELENQINQGLRNRQAFIENLERQFKYFEKIQHTKSFYRTTNAKPRPEFVYKPPLI
nr:hypothetical protein [Tanacetum cinerariifolium]